MISTLPQKVLKVPTAVRHYIEYDQGLLPQDEKAFQAFEMYERLRAVAKRAADAVQDYVDAHGSPPIPDSDGVWDCDKERLRENDSPLQDHINAHPATAVRLFAKWPVAWSKNRICEIAAQEPATSYALALELQKAEGPNKPIPEDLRDILEEGALKDPKFGFLFYRDIASANRDRIAWILRAHPFWYYLFNRLQNQNEPNANTIPTDKALMLDVPYSPEAATFWLVYFSNPGRLQQIALNVVTSSPKWSYVTALLTSPVWKPSQPEQASQTWCRLRNAAISVPQWAYHWWRDIEPEIAYDYLETVARHPGWAMQLVEDLRGPMPQAELVAKLDTLIRDGFTTNDPYFSAFIFRGADIVANTLPAQSAAGSTDPYEEQFALLIDQLLGRQPVPAPDFRNLRTRSVP